MKQGINSLFIYSKKGWWLVLVEAVGLVSLLYAIRQRYIYTEDTSVLFFLAFIILLGGSYVSAEKYLSCAENQYDLLAGIPSKNILWAIYGQVLWNNLRVASLFPLMLAAVTGTISLWLMVLMFLLFPIAAALAASFCNILITKYEKRLAAFFYLLFSLLWVGALAAVVWYLLADHSLSFPVLDNRHTWFIFLFLGTIITIILLFSTPLSILWKEAYLLKDAINKPTLPFKRFRQISRLFASAFLAKEWFLLRRNAFTKVRVIVWVMLLLLCSLTILKTYLYNPRLFLIISLVIWLFCFGELPATAWQNEGEQKSFYWLSGFKPTQLMAVKITAFLPLTVFGAFTPLFLGLAIHLSWAVMLQRAGLVLLLVLSAIIITLAAASFGHNGSKPTLNNTLLEQVPLTLTAIIAVTTEFLFCGIVLLPLYWTLFLSVITPIICLLGQAAWLNRNYYSV